MHSQTLLKKYYPHLETLLVFLLAAATRLTSLNVFRAIDEEDRWAWAVDFYQALLAGNLPATLVGDGYPGIFPVWLETLWLMAGAIYRSILQGEWLGDAGIYLLLHEWSRTEYLGVQRFPVALTNTLLVVIIFLYTRKLFGRWVGLLAAVLISLDPFYLSDSRVNRAEGLLTGLMMISLLALIAALRENNKQNGPSPLLPFSSAHMLISALFGGLAWLTKSQSITLIPMFTVITFIWILRSNAQTLERSNVRTLKQWLITMFLWGAGAALTFIALWPAAWTVPGDTFSLMFNYATRKVGAEGVKIFFLGRTILDEDPGLLFYPVIFFLRATPVMLAGLLLGLWQLFRHLRVTIYELRVNKTGGWSLKSIPVAFLDDAGTWALLAYALLYVGGMSLGSHKQDRFLMAAFPALNILAATAFVRFSQRRSWSTQKMWLGTAAILAAQLITALPFHPYYFSYFNPLVGGGPVAARLTRIGWGEGMDQVSAYLNNQEKPEEMVVATRFWRFMIHFKGQRLNLAGDGEWVRADRVVFYIQQAQRMLDPSPGVIRYFQQHVPPEKVITINRIDYATIYPNPIQYPADPLIDRVERQMSLFGYQWQSNPDNSASIGLIWENPGDSSAEAEVAVRLWSNDTLHSNWAGCTPRNGFADAAQTPGEVVESDCHLSAGALPPGLYDLQVGVRQPDGAMQSPDFAAGWSVVEVTDGGSLHRVASETAFAQLADAALPATATRLEHLYADRVRLLGYQLEPENPAPGQPLTVTFYWQAQRALDREAHISLQAFFEDNRQVAIANGPPRQPTTSWRPGEIIREAWQLELPPELATPALLRLDAGLFLPESLTPLPVTNLAGQDIPGAIGTVRLTPPEGWPTYQGNHPVSFSVGDSVRLIGYDAGPGAAQQLDVTLWWQANRAFAEGGPHTAFVHLLNPAGELLAQSDVQPANGLYPTPAWQAGDVVQSKHRLTLPQNLPPGAYTLLAGLYHTGDGSRLTITDSGNQTLPDSAAPIGRITLP